MVILIFLFEKLSSINIIRQNFILIFKWINFSVISDTVFMKLYSRKVNKRKLALIYV
jgi:hypothetical protein